VPAKFPIKAPDDAWVWCVQSNEPITLDDTDDEDGTAAAGQAGMAPRRSTRSNIYKGPTDIFKVPLLLVFRQT
jgi:hypothetical protein